MKQQNIDIDKVSQLIQSTTVSSPGYRPNSNYVFYCNLDDWEKAGSPSEYKGRKIVPSRLMPSGQIIFTRRPLFMDPPTLQTFNDAPTER